MKRKDDRQQKRVRFSLRWKITFPFIFLALTLGLGAAFLVNQLLRQTEEFQFLRQLADSGQQATDAIVRMEIDLLELERLIANTEGVSQAVALQNAEDLRARILPLVINASIDVGSLGEVCYLQCKEKNKERGIKGGEAMWDELERCWP